MLEYKTEIKICGITDAEEADMLNEFNVEYAGFVFAKSVRQITPAKAAEISEHMSPSIKKVGVFTDFDPRLINNLYYEGIIDIAQVHTRNYIDLDKIDAAVWVSLSISKDIIAFIPEGLSFIEGVHFDTYDKEMAGGTGRVFDWTLLSEFKSDKKLILSGGLNHDNVGNALEVIDADVVDVSSGVEGIKNGSRMKDRELIRRFTEEVRSNEKQR